MEPRPVPERALKARPWGKVLEIGPPPGIGPDDCGTAYALVEAQGDGPWAGLFKFHMYFQPTKDQLAELQSGGYVEVCIVGSALQPHYTTVQEA